MASILRSSTDALVIASASPGEEEDPRLSEGLKLVRAYRGKFAELQKTLPHAPCGKHREYIFLSKKDGFVIKLSCSNLTTSLKTAYAFCKTRGYDHLLISSSAYDGIDLVETYLPIEDYRDFHEHTLKQLELYHKDPSHFDKAVFQFIVFCCESSYPDLLTRDHPLVPHPIEIHPFEHFLPNSHFPRYDNVSLTPCGRIAIPDLDEWSELSQPHTSEALCGIFKALTAFFPKHADLILEIARAKLPRMMHAQIEQEIGAIETEFNRFYKTVFLSSLEFLDIYDISIEKPSSVIPLSFEERSDLLERISRALFQFQNPYGLLDVQIEVYVEKILNALSSYMQNKITEQTKQVKSSADLIYARYFRFDVLSLMHEPEFQSWSAGLFDLLKARGVRPTDQFKFAEIFFLETIQSILFSLYSIAKITQFEYRKANHYVRFLA